MKRTKKPWDGRFLEETDREVEAFTSSLSFDRRLYRQDVEGSIAHAKMLARQGIISPGEGKAIVAGLGGIRKDIEGGLVEFLPQDEDIHMAIERLLIDRIGEAGGKLHTGRSRNDQVTLDLRLYLREEIGSARKLLNNFRSLLLNLAEQERETIMPGYTHLQKAQPILLAHHLLAYHEMLQRDDERLKECHDRLNVLPLGAAALAGTGLPLDRGYTAKLLGFPRVSQNSLDAVSDRDYVAEFIFASAVIMMHLSRLSEDLIIWSSDEFRFVEIGDAFTTGSSIMPQKKNPDVAELIRGKTARIYGHLVTILTLLKGLPMSYNRDLQEDKEPLFDTIDTLKGSLAVLGGMFANLRFNRERMAEEASKGFSTATDLAEYLVVKGMPFRQAHAVVGRLVRYCLERKKTFTDLTIEEFRIFDNRFETDVREYVSVAGSISRKRVVGGTSYDSVHSRLKELADKSSKG